ncbi:hypothetical protein HRbin01_00272 [archaeon HR01]|nr:hypothetical protein HRbin01_00272 [archaeon HR01]
MFRPLSTYSIVAMDKEDGVMGVAVQSHWFSVGSIVAWAEPGVGVVATQSIVEASYGPLGLALMRGGMRAEQALKALLSVDQLPEVRQVAMLDKNGIVAVHTGNKCIPEAGHIIGDGFSVQANLMRSSRVWEEMAEAFKNSREPLHGRLLTALEAAEAAGGDIRGRQSACILVVKTSTTGSIWKDKIIDLRVEDHPEPLKELRRLVTLHEAYEHANRGDGFVAEGKINEALEEYRKASELAPDKIELKFWQALTMYLHNRQTEAEEIFKKVFLRNSDWKIVLKSLFRTGLFNIKEGDLEKILQL